jgi:hypothetical protein
VTNEQYAVALLRIAIRYDNTDGLFWREDDGLLRGFATCNDLFEWGTADCEEITPDMLGEYELAMKDAGEHAYIHGDGIYCARRRKMRPQGACYKRLPPAVAALYDACGPIRERDMLNPVSQP